MATTTMVLFNDFISIEPSLSLFVACNDTGVKIGVVRAVSILTSQVYVDDEVLYKPLYTYIENGVKFDVAKQSEIILRNVIEIEPPLP